MDDDDLDPAFAEFDLATAAPLSSSSLGRLDFERGRQHFDPDDFDKDEFLGSGNGLAEELDLIGELDEANFGRRDELNRAEPESTTHRLHDYEPVAGGPASRMSLAFELASAAEPNGRGSSLLRDLGLDEEDEGEDADEDDQNEADAREEDDAADQAPFANGGAGEHARRRTESRFLSFAPETQSHSPHLRSRSSTVALVTDTLDEEEIEVTFKEVTSSLEESIAAVQTSLAHLHDNLEPAPQSTNNERTMRPTSTTVSGSASSPSFVDRQPLVESLASSLVKSLYSTSKSREAHVRDMNEYERLLNRNEPGWDAVLSELDPLPLDEDIPSSPAESRPPAFGSTPGSQLPISDISTALPPSPDLAPGNVSARNPTTTVTVDFRELRSLTETLLAALASVSDIVQVQSALASEAGRKLRALRAQAATYKDELVGLDQSENFVADLEDRSRRNGGRREWAREARDIMRGVEEELNESSLRARTILEVR